MPCVPVACLGAYADPSLAASMTRCAWSASGQVAELFRAIDLDADGQIDYEDFMAAFAPDPRASEDGGTGRLADVKAAIQCVREGADAVIVLLEATKARVVMRELDLYETLHASLKQKIHFMCFLDEVRLPALSGP